MVGRPIRVVSMAHNSAQLVRSTLTNLPDGLEVRCVDTTNADDIAAVLSDLPKLGI